MLSFTPLIISLVIDSLWSFKGSLCHNLKIKGLSHWPELTVLKLFNRVDLMTELRTLTLPKLSSINKDTLFSTFFN